MGRACVTLTRLGVSMASNADKQKVPQLVSFLGILLRQGDNVRAAHEGGSDDGVHHARPVFDMYYGWVPVSDLARMLWAADDISGRARTRSRLDRSAATSGIIPSANIDPCAARATLGVCGHAVKRTA